MAKAIKIRNVPDAVHEVLKTRAASAGISLSAYLRRELALLATNPAPATRLTLDEMLDRLAKQQWVELPVTSADLIRQQRGPI